MRNLHFTVFPSEFKRNADEGSKLVTINLRHGKLIRPKMTKTSQRPWQRCYINNQVGQPGWYQLSQEVSILSQWGANDGSNSGTKKFMDKKDFWRFIFVLLIYRYFFYGTIRFFHLLLTDDYCTCAVIIIRARMHRYKVKLSTVVQNTGPSRSE